MSLSSGRTNFYSLRYWCLAEASTLLVLILVAVPLKHLADMSWAVSIMGPLHGTVFLGFCWNLVRLTASRELRAADALKLALAGSIPFGGLVSWKILSSNLDAVRNSETGGQQ